MHARGFGSLRVALAGAWNVDDTPVLESALTELGWGALKTKAVRVLPVLAKA
jgi:hypothetical protein